MADDVKLFDPISMHQNRSALLHALRNQTGDHEADHGRAETLLMDWMREFDMELATAWDEASDDWWYA